MMFRFVSIVFKIYKMFFAAIKSNYVSKQKRMNYAYNKIKWKHLRIFAHNKLYFHKFDSESFYKIYIYALKMDIFLLKNERNLTIFEMSKRGKQWPFIWFYVFNINLRKTQILMEVKHENSEFHFILSLTLSRLRFFFDYNVEIIAWH